MPWAVRGPRISAEATFHDAIATLYEVAHVQGHLAAQDELLTRIAAKIGLDPVRIIDIPALDETATRLRDADDQLRSV